MARNKKLKIQRRYKNEDRISMLPDELIHHIMSFFDTRLAVQTSILSKRWMRIWTTLPSLNFGSYCQTEPKNFLAELRFIKGVLNHRNQDRNISRLRYFAVYPQFTYIIKFIINFANSQKVQDLDLDLQKFSSTPIKLSTFSSSSTKKLKLVMGLQSVNLLIENMWDLPALTTLNLVCPPYVRNCKLPESCLIFLPSLQTLCLENFELPKSFCLLSLTTLSLVKCILAEGPYSFPALLTLQLDDVVYPVNVNEFFSSLVSLQNLTLNFHIIHIKDIVINCPELVNLKIISTTTRTCGSIMVLSPKVCNFTSFGIFSITFGGSELEKVNVRLGDHLRCKSMASSTRLRKFYHRFAFMFPGFGSARVLSLDLETIKALSMISDILVPFRSPFYNLEYLKLPLGCKESSICASIRSYLLDGSPEATIVTTLPQKDVISQAAQNMLLEQTLGTPTEELINTRDRHRKMRIDDAEEVRVQEDYVVKSSGIDVTSMRQVGGIAQESGRVEPSAPVAGNGNDQARSSMGDRGIGIWQGHEVNSEFIVLLNLIKKKYPETFENFTSSKHKMLSTMKLNMLCTTVNAYSQTSKSDANAEMVAEFRGLFIALQNLGFGILWLMNHLDGLWCGKPPFCEPWRSESPPGKMKMKIQTPIDSGCIGDDLFCGP